MTRNTTITRVDFTPTDAKRASARTLSRIRAGMEKAGAVELGNLFSLPLLKKVRDYVLRRHKSGELHKNGLVRDIGGRYAAVMPFEKAFLSPAFYANSKLTDMMSALLGADYCIGSLEAVIARPSSGEQHQHIDGPIRFDRSVRGKRERYKGDLSKIPPYAVTLCVPLCDVDEENGPTAIWPGSHRTALLPNPPGEAKIRRDFPKIHMDGKFGNAFIFDYRTFHCGQPNYSREPRPLLMFVFTRSWFRDPNLAEVHPAVVISKRNLAKVPERHRQLFMLAPAARRPIWPNASR